MIWNTNWPHCTPIWSRTWKHCWRGTTKLRHFTDWVLPMVRPMEMAKKSARAAVIYHFPFPQKHCCQTLPAQSAVPSQQLTAKQRRQLQWHEAAPVPLHRLTSLVCLASTQTRWTQKMENKKWFVFVLFCINVLKLIEICLNVSAHFLQFFVGFTVSHHFNNLTCIKLTKFEAILALTTFSDVIHWFSSPPYPTPQSINKTAEKIGEEYALSSGEQKILCFVVFCCIVNKNEKFELL